MVSGVVSILVLAAALLHAQAVPGKEVAWQSRMPENGQMPATETDGILTQFRYSPYAVGDNAFVSRPYRNGDTSNLATGWSVTRKDSAGRLTEVRHYSGNALPEVAVAATAGRDSWTYDGTTTIATDADSKVRHERRDALGRIDRVLEGGTLETTYTYNHLGNLTNVCQGAGCVQTREFRYTSLGQLQRAKNPEADEINYTYDVNGNLETKIQGPVATTLVYDALNRPTLKSYNDNPVTPAVRFCYDGTHSTLGGVCQAASTAVGNAIGRLTAVSNSLSSSLMLSFDPLGRVLGSRQVTPSTAQTITADLGYT